jgi:hypothetical protein
MTFQSPIKKIHNKFKKFISNSYRILYQNKEKYQKKKIDWSLICWKKNLIGEYGGF